MSTITSAQKIKLTNFLIIESGSTKCDWVFIHDNNQVTFQSLGINPITGAGLDQELSLDLIKELATIQTVYFYGAGANNLDAYNKMLDFFTLYVKQSFVLYIESDLLAACRAILGNEQGIVCILGTGSNSCYYDGEKMHTFTPSLGFLLSDEGSGNHIGKELLKSYFYNDMHESDKVLFFENYKITRDSVLTSLYKEPRVAAFLADFTTFLHVCSLDLKDRILSKVFNEFIAVRIKSIPNFSKFVIHFTGSVSYHFQKELQKALNENNCHMGIVLQKPIQNLIAFHKSRENVK
jgi:glucosamine kinase